MVVLSHALTHPGLRRQANEDTVLARPGLGFWVVCDGMGGHAAGEVASHVAAATIEAFVDTTDGVDAKAFTWPFGFEPDLGVDGTRLASAFKLANRAIEIRVQDDPALSGMATTAVALLLADGPWRQTPGWADPPPDVGSDAAYLRARIAHIGDSRAYLWRQGRLARLTRDHSWIEEQVAAGDLNEDEARTHPWRNLVTRALTGGGDPQPDVLSLALECGDRILLCSDGLTTPVTDAVIEAVLGGPGGADPERVCQTLVDAANAAGGPDNITVVVVEVA